MTTHLRSSWSEELQQLTRDAIEQIPITPDGYIHFKHPTLGAAYMVMDDLIDRRLVLRFPSGAADQKFSGVEYLLEAGWAVD